MPNKPETETKKLLALNFLSNLYLQNRFESGASSVKR